MILKKIPWSFLSVLIIAIVVTYPVWRFGMSSDGDAIFHSMWYTNFSRQVLAGDWFPKWLVEMNSGLGSPVFFFYGPLPYYLTLLFAPFGAHDQYGLSQLGLSAALSFACSGLTCYLWLRRSCEAKSAGLGSIVYILAPYHLKIDLYGRSAFAELWAFVWLPLILYFVTRLRDENRLALIGIAISYFALILTHLPSVVIFSFIPLVYALVRSDAARRLRAVVLTALGLILGAGLSAIYLLPAMTMQKEISMADFTAAAYHERWLHYQPFSSTSLESQLLWSVALMAALSIAAGVGCFLHSRQWKRELFFCEGLALASLFFMFPISNPLWQVFKTLQSIQFPWRFSSLLCLATAGVIANSFTCFAQSWKGRNIGVAAVSLCLFAVLATSVAYTVWQAWPSDSKVILNSVFLARFDQLRDAPEYRPATAHSIQEAEFTDLISHVCKSGPSLARACVSSDSASIATNSWKPRELSFSINSQTDASIKISQFYFPGWRAFEAGRELNLRASVPDGLIEFDLPRGVHSVELKLTRGPAEVIGSYLSLLSLILLICLFVLPNFKQYQ